MKVQIIDETREYNGFFKIDKVVFQYEQFDGTMSEPTTRLNFNRGDSVGVLLYNPAKHTVVLVKQFRYPAYINNGPGWILEIVAGMQDEDMEAINNDLLVVLFRKPSEAPGVGERSEQCLRNQHKIARAEVIEEAGYNLKKSQFLCTFYVSPGGTSERIHLYVGYVDKADRVGDGGGLKSHHEDTQVVELEFDEAFAMIETGEICDAKTIIALQWLKLQCET